MHLRINFKVILLIILLIYIFPCKVKAEELNLFYYSPNSEDTLENVETLHFHGNFSENEKAYILFYNLMSNENKTFIPQNTQLLSANIINSELQLNFSSAIKNYGGTYYENHLINLLKENARQFTSVNKITLLIDNKLSPLPEGSLVYKTKIK